MTYTEFVSMAVTSVALAGLSLALATAEPKSPAPSSVCMVAPVQEASKEGWVCGHPIAEIDDPSTALLRKPVHTSRGDFVGTVVNFVRAANGKVDSIVVRPEAAGRAPANIMIDARDVLALDKPAILITTLRPNAATQASIS